MWRKDWSGAIGDGFGLVFPFTVADAGQLRNLQWTRGIIQKSLPKPNFTSIPHLQTAFASQTYCASNVLVLVYDSLAPPLILPTRVGASECFFFFPTTAGATAVPAL